MPKMRVTQLGVNQLYLTRRMMAGDEVEIEPQCVDAARALGYVEDLEPGAQAASAPHSTRRRQRINLFHLRI